MIAWIGLSVGAVLLLWSLWATLRANQGCRVPYLTNAEVIPRGSILARAIGVGIYVFAALSLAARFTYWPALILAAGGLVAVLAIAVHNRRMNRRSVTEATT